MYNMQIICGQVAAKFFKRCMLNASLPYLTYKQSAAYIPSVLQMAAKYFEKLHAQPSSPNLCASKVQQANHLWPAGGCQILFGARGWGVPLPPSIHYRTEHSRH
eukprot:1160996-Pelagomonas_calceolata.AAC.14